MSYLDQLTDVFAEFIVVGEDVHEDRTLMRLEDLSQAMRLLGLANDEKNVVDFALKLDPQNTEFIEFEKFVEVMSEALDSEVPLEDRRVPEETIGVNSGSDGDGGGFMADDESEGYIPSGGDSDSDGGGGFMKEDVVEAEEEEREVGEEGEVSEENEMQLLARQKKVEEAFLLFTNGQNRPISLSDLRRISKEVKDTATDEQLQDMIRLSGKNQVDLSSFSEIMRQMNGV